MNKSLLILIIFLSIGWNSSAQTVEWAQRIGNVKSDKITSIKTDGLGYIYIAGYFSTSLTLGTNGLVLNYAYNSTSKEAYIAKLDSTGYCYWAKAGGGYYDDRVLGMDVDSAGYSVITGTFWEGVGFSFPPNAINGSAWGNSDQCFIAKFDPNGNYMWGTYVCGDDVTPSGGNYRDDQGLDVAMDKAGNIYAVGFMTTVTLYCGGNAVTATNPNTGQHKHCYWLAKFDAAGIPQWARTFGHLPWDAAAGKYIERDIAVCTDESDGVYVTGGFDSTRQFGPQSLTPLGGYDVFLLKYDTNGVFKWVSKAGSDKDDWANGICSDKNGHIYFTGEHRDSLIMDTVLVKNYDKRDAFLFKVDQQTGKPYWGKRAGSDEGGERGNDVWADDKCNVYLVGDINEGAKFGDDIIVPANGDSTQSFIARITPEGKWSWVRTYGAINDEDRGNAVAKGKANQVYLAGYFRQSANYGGNVLVSAGSSDGFFTRIYDSMLNKGTPFEMDPPAKTILCFGDTAHLKIPKHATFSITPTNGVTFNSDSTKMVFGPSATTTYTLIGSSAGQCPDFDTLIFTLSVGLQGFSFTPLSDTIMCSGDMISHALATHDYFSVSPTAGTSLGSGGNTVNFFPSSTTTYTLTGYSLGVCPSYDTLVVTIVVGGTPNADFDFEENVILLDQPTFKLVNKSTGATFYQWYKGSQLFSTNTNPSVTESAAGNYCYTLVAESLAGCKDTVTKCGDIIKDERVFFPNAFSPNGDLNNDEFNPIFINIDKNAIKEFNFLIANRYGQIIYSSKDPSFGWDGRWKGTPCELGTYYYTCKFILPNGKVYDVKGDVSLVY
jgi:gliding motility-associated-like protein